MEPGKPSYPPIRHIAIIMDGNKRWAEQHGLPTLKGHGKGAETVHKIVKAAKELGIEYLTLRFQHGKLEEIEI